MTTKDIRISDYDYALPDERIAKYPAPERDMSKLLVYDGGTVGEDVFRSVGKYIPTGALMVFNNAKVIQARIHFRKSTGARIEVFLLEPHAPADYESMFQQTGECSWVCMVGNLKKWKGEPLVLDAGDGLRLTATLGGAVGTGYEVRFRWDAPGMSFAEVIDRVGELPIPPYLNRASEESDKSTYQTVYSKIKGSVAAPTAGLHFTERVLSDIRSRGIDTAELTLHVGAGTFRPVKSERIGEHDMHSEAFAVSRRTIESILAHDCRVVAVGTTSVRTIESLYYIGMMLRDNPAADEDDIHVGQWQPYEEEKPTPAPSLGRETQKKEGRDKESEQEALEAILAWMDSKGIEVINATTRIIIAPGYRFHYVERLITNFHQPQSTLLLLISAFISDDWRKVYSYALENGFRFLSYGDSSILIPKRR
ncbi:MAG: S-adenosylmethionine:tRNA ribosyltransferase-isomerase [Prevotella sp.]|nr:S-adenosylmethionine:tRNA ribosyltransferase-isomerase [Prevotella sp.]